MAARGSAPIGLAFAGLGGILILSGIQGQSLAEIVRGEWGKGTSHELPNPSSSKGNSGNSSTGGSSSESAGSSEGESSPGTSANSAPGSPLGKAIPPSSIQVPHTKAGVVKRRHELAYGLEKGLQFKGQLENAVKSGRITSTKASEVFNETYPWYGTWARELKALT